MQLFAKPSRRTPASRRSPAERTLLACPASSAGSTPSRSLAGLPQHPPGFRRQAAGGARGARGRGRSPQACRLRGGKVLVESHLEANPTARCTWATAARPRQGRDWATCLIAQGAQVWREFYYNDAGVQIPDAGQQHAVAARAASSRATPNGPSRRTTATTSPTSRPTSKKTVKSTTASARRRRERPRLDIRQFAVAYLRDKQDLDLQASRCSFDHIFESSSTPAAASRRRQACRRQDLARADAGALWLKSTEARRDDKDRVMRRRRRTYVLRARRRLPPGRGAVSTAWSTSRGNRLLRHHRARTGWPKLAGHS